MKTQHKKCWTCGADLPDERERAGPARIVCSQTCRKARNHFFASVAWIASAWKLAVEGRG